MQRIGESRRREEFEAMTRPHLDALFRTALRMTGQRQAAEDLVQEACLRAFRGFHGFIAGSNFKAWLFRIMTNACIDEAKRRRRMTLVPLDPASPEGEQIGEAESRGSVPADPETSLHNKSFRDDALRATARLAPDVRLVVILAVFEEFTYAEIAETMGCPLGTVRSRLSRGRQQLQAMLRRYRGAEDPKPASAHEPRPSGGAAPAADWME